jgi:hypothetical protein
MPRRASSPSSGAKTPRSRSRTASKRSESRDRSASRPSRSSSSKSSSASSSTRNEAVEIEKTVFQHRQEVIKSTAHGHAHHVNFLYWLTVVSCMIIVPLFVYWCWICVHFNRGLMLLPKALTQQAFMEWWNDDVWGRILSHCIPSFKAWHTYTIWILLQALLYHYAPGDEGYGAILEDGKTKLKYKYNGQFAFFFTIITAIILHYTRIFPLTEVFDLFPELLTVCNAWTCGVILFLYIHGAIYGLLERRTDSHIYDYFMGPRLNPRFDGFDVKFFFELRPGIMHWFFTSVAIALKMYERDGTITTPMLLICFYHLCFVNSCYKGEACVPFSMDIIYEKFGWMLLMLDIVMVPFVFPLQAYYLYVIEPFEHPWYISAALLFTHCFAYFMFDTANAQKDYFREEDHPENAQVVRKFPRLPWSKLHQPKYLQTKRGTKLLLSGWWGIGRHMNYTGDILMSWTWGLTCGVGSYFPFAYTTYLSPLLIHRELRDDRDCARKYGQDWEDYKKLVPYRLIPGIY